MSYRSQSTTYLWIPIITILPIIYSMVISLTDNLYSISKSLSAYAICSREMIDYAFVGETFNYTECFNTLKEYESLYNCNLLLNESLIICVNRENGETYRISLSMNDYTINP